MNGRVCTQSAWFAQEHILLLECQKWCQKCRWSCGPASVALFLTAQDRGLVGEAAVQQGDVHARTQ